MFIFKITSPMNSKDGWFFKLVKTFASDLYLTYTNSRLRLEFVYQIKIGCLCFNYYFKNSLIINEENTKKNHKRVVSLYVIEISVDLHKL
jgi:hypothetical protein